MTEQDATDTLDIAVIGTGISGLSAAWLLSQRHRVTVYEAGARPGGHSHTVDVRVGDVRVGDARVRDVRVGDVRVGDVAVDGTCDRDASIAVDIGFIVYNEETYPNLTALFRHLGVATQASDMSFGVSLDDGALEYAGTDLAGLFAQPLNVGRPRFWSMLSDLRRFYREAPAQVAAAGPDIGIGDFLDQHGYGAAFQQDHILPMAAAIWSASTMRLRDYPAAGFIRFFENHGLLRFSDRPLWRTVVGGSRTYVHRMSAAFVGGLRLACAARSVRRLRDGVIIGDSDGEYRRHDHVVIATHANQALDLLDDPTEAENDLLGAFHYTANTVMLHNDPSFMPRRKRAWSSWNYLGQRGEQESLSVTYWMNRLQGIPDTIPLFVTLNPRKQARPGSVFHRQDCAHPQFDQAAMRAQRALWSLQGRLRTWYCGAYFGAGFHEDGLQAGLAVAEQLGGVRRPWTVAHESGRIHVSAAPVRRLVPA